MENIFLNHHHHHHHYYYYEATSRMVLSGYVIGNQVQRWVFKFPHWPSGSRHCTLVE